MRERFRQFNLLKALDTVGNYSQLLAYKLTL